jgi:hypothetical protein
MIFADLPINSAVFVDANIFVFYFQPHAVLGPPCTTLIKRTELKELVGFTSTHVLGEVAHRLMTMEASMKFVWQGKAQAGSIDPATAGRLPPSGPTNTQAGDSNIDD